MSPFATLIQTQINQYISTYALDAFINKNLNRILNLILQLADGNSSGGSGASSGILPLTSANFSTATNCPLSQLANASFAVYYNEGQRFLDQDLGEWSYLAGGGFTVNLAGFNSTTQTYHFYVFVTGGLVADLPTADSTGNVIEVTSANFTTASSCPIAAMNGHGMAIYWSEGGRFLEQANGDFTPLSGGGFTINIANFNKSTANYHFYVFKTS